MRPPLPAPPARKVLAIDDSATVRAAMEALLEPLGFEVVHAEHGAAALQLLRTSAFDLVFLDLEMPVLDGPSLLRFMRQHRDPTRVVLLTSAETSSVAATIKLGVSDYLPKPFDARGVRAVLDRVLGDQARLEPDEPRLLVVDGPAGAAAALQSALPPHAALDEASGAEAEALAHDRPYRVLAFGPGADEELRRAVSASAPAAALLGLGEGAGAGDGALPWPAPPEALRAPLLPICLRPLVSAGGARVQLASFRGEPAQEPLYFTLAARRLHVALEWQRREAAAVVVDLTRAPPRPDAVSALIEEAGIAARDRSLELMFLVPRDLEKAFAGLAYRFIVRAP
jgi:CheY-like chemotaxis protein